MKLVRLMLLAGVFFGYGSACAQLIGSVHPHAPCHAHPAP